MQKTSNFSSLKDMTPAQRRAALLYMRQGRGSVSGAILGQQPNTKKKGGGAPPGPPKDA